ncbi:MAG: nucleotidyl transferase AbiEii/AbiGii toxin family protein [Candidatus Woesearchaeota archaeon]
MEIKVDLKEEINRLSYLTKFSSRLIEKDYYLTLILHEISNKKIPDLVFKGGTCLNKCYLGFYRLSEDLDFIINKDFTNTSNTQLKKLLDNLRRELFEIFDILNLNINKKIGEGWKMIHSDENKIIGFEAITNYKSIFDGTKQEIKIEISFRNKLIEKTKTRIIKHEFFNSLNKPLLKENVTIECIDLKENFAEKIRALITRENIAIRDIFDIYIILSRDLIKVDKKFIKLCLIKINETKTYNENDLYEFINNLDKIDINEKELYSVLKSSSDYKLKDLIKVIQNHLLPKSLREAPIK